MALLAVTDVAHLYNHERVLALWSSGKEDVGVEFPRSPFDAIPEMLNQRRRSGFVERAASIKLIQRYVAKLNGGERTR